MRINYPFSIINFQKQKQGFTLVELLVVTAILVLVIGAVTASFFSSLKGANKTTIVNEARQSGNHTISFIEKTVINARDVITSCPITNSSSFSVISGNGQSVTFNCPVAGRRNIRVDSEPDDEQDGFLGTTNKTETDLAGCSFSCTARPSVAVTVKFTIRQKTLAGVTPRPEDTVSIPYQASMVVRNISN